MAASAKYPLKQSEFSCGPSNCAYHPSIVPCKHGDYRSCPAVSCLELHPLFGGILPSDYSGISITARVKEFERGEMLYLEGDSVPQVLLITEGFVKITQLGNSGAEVIIRLCGPGDVLGVMSLFSSVKHCTTAQAFRKCRALVWDVPTFKALVARFPVLLHNVLRIVYEDLRKLEVRFREVATERVGPRVARQLVRLHGEIGQKVNGDVRVCLSREDLAQMTGTTLFTVSRLLSAWEVHGMVKPCRESVTICDVESLRAMSELS